MDKEPEDGCPIGSEELWVTVQAANVCNSSRALEVDYNVFPVY